MRAVRRVGQALAPRLSTMALGPGGFGADCSNTSKIDRIRDTMRYGPIGFHGCGGCPGGCGRCAAGGGG